ncbi:MULTISPECIES: TatD family hydrolase [unclassified Lentimicrobium]|uniref:TatD family hydrolase n=1 Tax=unclassified Lentimicrobium TaxID=2677434 RepID=UPI0015518F90|nr:MULTISPECIES: TatD family hydrolase [unclassified Lentimicrobium]NPD46124.1 TatD family hydrolase [Lentimicrobium sp. S6]NPD86474.1 TatD family hydrolase [Lentimicrobium sp. L6]
MILLDTHTHLYLPEFDEDRAEMLERASQQGVQKMILPNIDSESIPKIQKMRREFPDYCVASMGLHPTSVKENFEEELKACYEELKNGQYMAIGEMGIDLYWDKSFYEQQKIAFKKQIDWALEFDLPIIIHSRDSFDEIFELMDEVWNPKLRGVFHCFSGNKAQAEKIINDYHFKLGIGGVLTFKNSTLREEIKDISLSHLILETDAPFLAPVPNRGKRNESAYVALVAQKLAELKGISIEEVADITTKNAMDLFNFENI